MSYDCINSILFLVKVAQTISVVLRHLNLEAFQIAMETKRKYFQVYSDQDLDFCLHGMNKYSIICNFRGNLILTVLQENMRGSLAAILIQSVREGISLSAFVKALSSKIILNISTYSVL